MFEKLRLLFPKETAILGLEMTMAIRAYLERIEPTWTEHEVSTKIAQIQHKLRERP